MLDQQSFIRELEGEVDRAKRGSKRLSVLVGQLGSPGRYEFVSQRASDPLLERAGEALVDQKRQMDVVASLGQGRFALILPETGEPGALMVAERLQAAVASVFREDADAPRLSFGVASFGRHGRSANALLGASERAALAAKELDQDGSMVDRDEIAAAMAMDVGTRTSSIIDRPVASG